MTYLHQLIATLTGWLSALMLAITGPVAPPTLTGYVDADWVRVAPEVPGRIAELAVRRGDLVAPGALLFRLDDATERAAEAEAAARLATAEAQLANLKTGKRPEEIAVIAAQVAESEARLVMLKARVERRQVLASKQVMSVEGLQETTADLGVEEAKVVGMKAQLAVARLPARPEEIRAAEAAVQTARAVVDQAAQALAKRTIRAPVAAQVQDLLHWPGEQLATGAAVAVLLPPLAIKVRAFVPEPLLGGVRVGQGVHLRCDGCGAPITGRISFIATEAEYTPPVIYSVGSRQKLVFMIEVRPERDPERLHPGQPVDVLMDLER